MRDGFAAPPLVDEQLGQVLAQRQVLGPFLDHGAEGVNEGIRHAHKPTGWQARRSTHAGAN